MLFTAKLYKQAEELAKQAIAEDPEDADNYCLLSKIQVNLGQKKEAVQTAQKAVELDSNYEYAHYVLASAYLENYQIDEAVQSAKEAIELDPTSASLHSMAAWALSCRSQYEEALEEAEKSLELEPGNLWGMKEKASILRSLRRFEEAEQLSTEILNAAPNSVSSHLTKGYLAKDTLDTDSMFKHFQNALQISPDDENAHFAMAVAYQAKGDLENAKKFYNSALAKSEKELACSLGLAEILLREGKPREAKSVLEKAREFYPDKYSLLAKCASVTANLGETKELLELANKLVELDPKNMEGYTYLQYYYYLLRQPEKADKLTDEFLAKYPSEFNSFSLEMCKAEYRKDYKQLETLARTGVETYFDKDFYSHKLLLALREQEKFDEAKLLLDTLSKDMKPMELLHEKFFIAIGKRNYAEAENCMQEALKLEPANGNSWNNLKRAVTEKYLGKQNFTALISTQYHNLRDAWSRQNALPLRLFLLPFYLVWGLILIDLVMIVRLVEFAIWNIDPATRPLVLKKDLQPTLVCAGLLIFQICLIAGLKYVPFLFQQLHLLFYPARLLAILWLLYYSATKKMKALPTIFFFLFICVLLSDVIHILRFFHILPPLAK